MVKPKVISSMDTSERDKEILQKLSKLNGYDQMNDKEKESLIRFEKEIQEALNSDKREVVLFS